MPYCGSYWPQVRSLWRKTRNHGMQDSPSVAEQRAFLKKYCVTCHNDKLRTAGLSLESVNLSDVTQSGEALEKVVRKLAQRRHAARLSA